MSTTRSDGCVCDPTYEDSDPPLSTCPVHGHTGPVTPGQRCDMYVRTSAPPDDQLITTRRIGNDVYVDRNEHGDVVGVEVLDARDIWVNGIAIPFPGNFRGVFPARSRCPGCPWPTGTPCGGAYGVCEGNATECPPGYPIHERCGCGWVDDQPVQYHRYGGDGCRAGASR